MNATKKVSVTAGTTSAPVFIIDVDATVTAVPGGGGTMSVASTTSTHSDINAGIATWTTWPSGTVAATTSLVLSGRVTAVRATATTADGVLEVCQ